MTTTQTQPTPTPDEIWAILKATAEQGKENDRRAAERSAIIDRKFEEVAEQMKETDRKFEEVAEQMKETDRKFAETDREIREIAKLSKETKRELKKAQNMFTTQWGKLMESLVEGDLVKLLKHRGIEVKSTSKTHKGQMSYIDEHGKEQEMLCEVDIIAKDGEKIVVVEVKTTLRVQDVDKFIGILQKFHQLLPEYRDKKVYGAVAYLQAQEGSEVYAAKQGLFVIKATGSSASITNKEGFQAKEFG